MLFLFRNGEDLNQLYGLMTTQYLSNEMDYVPWDAAANNLDYFILMFKYHGSFGSLKVRIDVSIIDI